MAAILLFALSAVLAYNIPSSLAAIYQLMKAPGCAGIRIYPAINSKQQLTLVTVGVDERGENILDPIGASNGSNAKSTTTEGKTVLDEGQTSPPYPAPGNGF